MTTKHANVRLALDEAFIQDYFEEHFRLWFPTVSKIHGIEIKIQRNFLNEFVALALRYKVRVTRRGKRKTLVLRAQARAAKHVQAKSPRISYRVVSHLWNHGMQKLIYRPIAYNAKGNFFLYEDTPGTSLERIIHPKDHAKRAAHPPRYITRFAPQMANALRELHRFRRVPGAPRITRRDHEADLRDYFRLITKYHPTSVKPLKRALKRCREAYPNYHRHLFSPTRRRLIHGDMHPGNFIHDKGHLTMIDFGDCGMHDPMNDVGRLFVQTHFLLRFVHKEFQPGVMNDIRIIFLNNYFKSTAVSPMNRYALNYFAVTNLIQMMSIASFSSEKHNLNKAMKYFRDGVNYFTERLETLTY